MSEGQNSRTAISFSYAPIPATLIGPLRVEWGSRTYIMAVANLTPDSFSGDGLMASAEPTADLLDRVELFARSAVRDGADMLDLGAESTRPGHTEISVAEEIARLVPAIARLRRVLPTLALSADTQKVEVAAAALDAGAHMLNDIWGTRSGDEMLRLAADRGVPIVIMHNRNEVATGERGGNFTEEFLDEMAAVASRGRALGIPPEQLILDPGFGFGKSPAQNLVSLQLLGTLRDLGHPVLLGTSRKSTLGRVIDGAPVDRLAATVATSALGALAGVDIVRVHDVQENRDAVRVIDATLRARGDQADEAIGLNPNRGDRPPRPSQRDRISVRNVRFDAAHGVYPEEHEKPQPFFVDVEVDADLAAAGRGDALAASVDYSELVRVAVERVGAGGHADLIEALAERIADGAMEVVATSGATVYEVRVRVRKPQAAVAAPIDWAGVEVVRKP
ncbi:MAG: dihydropteroate synthase [bacterium]